MNVGLYSLTDVAQLEEDLLIFDVLFENSSEKYEGIAIVVDYKHSKQRTWNYFTRIDDCRPKLIRIYFCLRKTSFIIFTSISFIQSEKERLILK